MICTCKICGATSQDVKFYEGVKTRCKECHKRKVRENRLAKVDYYRQYDANRFQNDPRVRERHERYRKTESGKQAVRRAQKKWLAQNQEKRAAHIILGNAVRDGKVSKPKFCSDCGQGNRLEGHHEDYSKPLDVIWLCRQCHANRHKIE